MRPLVAQTKLGVLDAVAIIVGIIIGSGIFVAPAHVAGVSGGLTLALVLWLAAGAVAACGALTYAECSSRFPQDGGFFVYYREAFGDWLGFTGGWAAQLVTYPASVAAIAHLCAQYSASLVPALNGRETWVACFAIAVSGTLNGIGLRSGALTQRALTATKVLAIVALGAAACVTAWFASASGPSHSIEWFSAGAAAPSLSDFSAALLLLLWSYDGWSDISMVAGALRDPGRMLVRSVLISMAVLAGCYVLVQVAVLAVLPLDVAAASQSVFADATQAALGDGAGAWVAALIVLSTFGSMHGIVFTVSRLGSSMARDGDFFRWFAPVDESRGVPLRSLGLMVGASLVYALVSDFR
ncbi:MAG: amino acid permease, partial [Myxococcota bacterium]